MSQQGTVKPLTTVEPKASGAAPVNTDALMERIKQLELEKIEAQETAQAFREQCELLKTRGPGAAEMATTTTKPTYKFTVTGPNGPDTFDVVDESEAKRLYCIRHKLEPSLFALGVVSEDAARRRASIEAQYKQAGVAPDRIPQTALMS